MNSLDFLPLYQIIKQLYCLDYAYIDTDELGNITAVQYDENYWLEINLPDDIRKLAIGLLGKNTQNTISELLEEDDEFRYFVESESPNREYTTIRHKPNVLKANKADYIDGEYLVTLNGLVKVNEGDWVITGVNGEKYPCDPEIFKELYDIVD